MTTKSTTMAPSVIASRVRLSAAALIIAGCLFVLYPAIRPFSDEVSLQGAAAFASPNWLAAHMLAMVAFILLPLGLLGLHYMLQETAVERLGFWAIVLSWIGIGLTLPYYGGEAYGLHAIGQEALRRQSANLMSLADVVRSGPGLVMFGVGLLLLAVAAIMVAIAVWRSDRLPKWSGVPFAIGFALYIPQFYGSQPLRVAHGLLVAIGCVARSGLVEAKLEAKRSTVEFGARYRWSVTTQHRQPPMAQRKVWAAGLRGSHRPVAAGLGLVRRGRADRVKGTAIRESRLFA